MKSTVTCFPRLLAGVNEVSVNKGEAEKGKLRDLNSFSLLVIQLKDVR